MISREMWLAARNDADKISDNPDALTSRELTAIWNLSQRAVQVRLEKMIARGLVEQVVKRGPHGIRPAYVLVPTTTKKDTKR